MAEKNLALRARYFHVHPGLETDSPFCTNAPSHYIAWAEQEGWSQRRLAAQIAIPATTLRRLRDQKGNPLVWFPRIQSAMHRLNPS